MSGTDRIVVVHGAPEASFETILEKDGLRRVMRMDDITIWLHDTPSPSPAALRLAPAGRGGPERLLLTVVQAAAILGVGRTTAYELIRRGELEVVHVGRSARVPAEAIEAFIEAVRGRRRSSHHSGSVEVLGSAEASQHAAASHLLAS